MATSEKEMPTEIVTVDNENAVPRQSDDLDIVFKNSELNVNTLRDTTKIVLKQCDEKSLSEMED